MNLLETFRDWEDQVEYPRGAVIFEELDAADYMYVLLEGEVELTLRGEPLAAELPGGIIGEMAMLNLSTRSATATALVNTKMARIDQERFKHIISENPDFALHLMQVMSNRLRVADQIIVG